MPCAVPNGLEDYVLPYDFHMLPYEARMDLLEKPGDNIILSFEASPDLLEIVVPRRVLTAATGGNSPFRKFNGTVLVILPFYCTFSAVLHIVDWLVSTCKAQKGYRMPVCKTVYENLRVLRVAECLDIEPAIRSIYTHIWPDRPEELTVELIREVATMLPVEHPFFSRLADICSGWKVDSVLPEEIVAYLDSDDANMKAFAAAIAKGEQERTEKKAQIQAKKRGVSAREDGCRREGFS